MFWNTKLPLWFATIVIICTGILIVSVIIEYSKVFEQTYAVVPIEQDPTCNGEQNENYSLGFGVEHRYNGEVIPGKKVNIVLSCDHTRFVISGAVNQIIATSTEMADLVAGTEVVRVESDYNFDGYNDLSTISSNGSGISQIDSYYIFLYSTSTNRFILNEKLSSLQNIFPKSDTKEITQYFNFNRDGYDAFYYKWTAGGRLYKSKEDSCQSSRQLNTKSDSIDYYVQETTKYTSAGKVSSHTKKQLDLEQAQSICVPN